jgi:hypothetical protein
MRISLSLSICAVWTACSAERPSEPDPRYTGATEISTSCGGGFAGTYGGTTVHRDGRVEVWVESAGVPGDERREEHRADPRAVAELFARVERSGFLDMPPGQPSNWCCTVTLSGPARTFAVHYEGEPQGALAELVASIQALVPPVQGK